MLQITIDKGSAAISILKDGVKQFKSVDLGELVSVMQAHAVHDFGLLPPNTRYLSQAGNNYTIAVEVPSGPRDLNLYVNKSTKVVPKVNLPAALFFFQLVQRDGGFYHSSSYLFALATDRLMLRTDKLFKYPTPNIYPEDNRICWGQNDLKDKALALSAVEGWIRTFYLAASNGDLFDSGKVSNTFPWSGIQRSDGTYDVEAYYNTLAKAPFKTEWLKTPQGGFTDFETASKKLGR